MEDKRELNRIKPDKDFIPMADDNMIICRCEEITKGEIRRAIYDGMLTMNEIKRYLRPGMGLCQGLTCGRLVKDILAREMGEKASEIAAATARPPARPVTLETFADNRE